MHVYANPARFLKSARPLTAWLGWTGAALILVALALGLFYAPPERLQGESVRIIYLHVPAAWLGMAGWTGIAVASLMQLVWRHPLAAVAARAVAVPGAVFTFALPRHRLALGPADLGHLLGMGRADDLDAGPALPLFRLHRSGRRPRRRRAGKGGSPRSSGWSARSTFRSSIISVIWWNTLHQGAEHQLPARHLDDRRADALAVARLDARLLPAVRRDRADADARRARAAPRSRRG